MKVSIVQTDLNKEMNSIFLGAVTNYVNKPWMVSLKLNNKYTEFCIDTGAEVSAILESTYKRIGSPELQSMDKELKGPNNCRLESASRFRGMLQKGDQIAQEDIYVVKNLHRSLLGKPAIKKLHILARIDSVN